MNATTNSSGTRSKRPRTQASTASRSSWHQPFSLTLDCLQWRNLEHSAIEERWISVGLASDGKNAFCRISLVRIRATDHKSSAYFRPPGDPDRDPPV
jgi:hypothetical protein